ncbi:MAG TPA: CAP domain-containing protein [Gaiellaceae bacterium]|nr:CAP domain-containing protein [Gaiellaceae bacterium]
MAARLSRIGSAIAVCAVAAALLPLPASPSGTASSTSTLAALQSGILAQLNQIRRAHGLAALQLDQALSTAAAQHTAEMLADGYFAHESADGSAFWKRIQRFYPSARYSYWSVGENLLWSPGALDAAAAVKLWMASPEHRANILVPDWRDVGIAATYDPDAPGTFDGSATVVAADFGVRY